MTQHLPLDVHELLATRRQIALVWSSDDVRAVRPDLTDDQCWDVLQAAKHQHDALLGLSWDTLRCIADELCWLQPLTQGGDDAE
jgi:hypothetical protein